MMSYVDQELTVEEMLADPIVQTLMRYDGICAKDVRHTIEKVNRNRAENPPHLIATSAHHNRRHWAAMHPTANGVRHNAA